jgi:hypothetical protein
MKAMTAAPPFRRLKRRAESTGALLLSQGNAAAGQRCEGYFS